MNKELLIGFVDRWKCESVCLTWARTWVQSPGPKPEGTGGGQAEKKKKLI